MSYSSVSSGLFPSFGLCIDSSAWESIFLGGRNCSSLLLSPDFRCCLITLSILSKITSEWVVNHDIDHFLKCYIFYPVSTFSVSPHLRHILIKEAPLWPTMFVLLNFSSLVLTTIIDRLYRNICKYFSSKYWWNVNYLSKITDEQFSFSEINLKF